MNKISKTFLIPILVTLFIIGIIFSNTIFKTGTSADKGFINYDTFKAKVENNEIKSISINDQNKLLIEDKNNFLYTTVNPDYPTFKKEMADKGIYIETKKVDNTFAFVFQIIIFIAIYFIVTKFLIPNPNKQIGNKLNFSQIQTPVKNLKPVKFSDVAGLEEEKQEVWEFVEYLENPKSFSALGISPLKGAILEGPPGTGKTYLGRAIAGEAGVPFFYLSGSEFVEMFVGVGASRVRDLFARARLNSPCVVFIDEVDAIAKQRSSMGGKGSNDEREQALNQLLVELDGAENNDGIITFVATNRLDMLDSAFTRSGRFDKTIQIGVPDQKGRLEILKIHARKKPLGVDVELEKVASMTSGFVASDLESLLNESGIFARRRNAKHISMKDIENAYYRILVGPSKSKLMITEAEKRLTSYHEVGHALVTRLLAGIKINRITNIPSAKALGYVMRDMDTENHYLKTKTELFQDICICLGGRVAEKIIYGEENVTTGASHDYKQAYRIATAMVFEYGMSDLGTIYAKPDSVEFYNLSDEIKNKGYNEVEKILNNATSQTEMFLKDNLDTLKRIAMHLITVENMNGKEFDDILFQNPNITNIKNTRLQEVTETHDTQEVGA